MKKKWVAGLFSLIFPGFGHLYLGKIRKGLLLMVLNVISMFLISVVIGLLLAPAVWIYAIINSIKETETINSFAEAH